jgi:ABC-2 type transport system ATP-binding protein
MLATAPSRPVRDNYTAPVPDSEPVALQVERLGVRFGRRIVLDGLTLEAAPGRLTAVLGPNGAGKTTLLRCCTGLVRPYAGTVQVLGERPGSAALAARVGLMPQSTGAWSAIHAVELLNYLAGLYSNPLDVDRLVSRLNLGGFAKTPYRRLSGGQQQAVNLAGALIGRPELVFLDEPTAGMDPHARRSTWQLLTELRTAGVTIVLTTHAMDEAEALADQVYIVDQGRVAVAGTVAELTRSGQSLETVFLNHTQAPAA